MKNHYSTGLVRHDPWRYSDPDPIPSKVFIGSSTEGLAVAEAIQCGLSGNVECTIWNQGIFKLSSTTIESIFESAGKFNFAILVLTPDDTTIRRGKKSLSAGGNLLFELGLFIGTLGREKTILVHPQHPRFILPSDLNGITTATYIPHTDRNLQAALGPVCTRIKGVIGVGLDAN